MYIVHTFCENVYIALYTLSTMYNYMYMTQFTRIIIRRAYKLCRYKDTMNSVYFAMTLPKYLEAAKFTFLTAIDGKMSGLIMDFETI